MKKNIDKVPYKYKNDTLHKDKLIAKIDAFVNASINLASICLLAQEIILDIKLNILSQ